MCCRVVEGNQIEVEPFVRILDDKEGTVLPLVWEDPDLIAYVKLWAKYLDSRGFGALTHRGRASKIVYVGRSRATVYRAWLLRQEEFGTLKEHTKDEMDMPVLHDESEAAYFLNLARLMCVVEAI